MLYKYKIFGLVANIALISNDYANWNFDYFRGNFFTRYCRYNFNSCGVDANVLIFERIKEELKTEKSIIHAFDSGYSKAKLPSDANITTQIAAAILFAFGSGPVKGFAVTLGIGIITTLFTAYFLARHITSFVVLRNNNKEVNI